jgi:hypothetical protein
MLYLIISRREDRWEPFITMFHNIGELLEHVKIEEYSRQNEFDEYNETNKTFKSYCDGGERYYTFIGLSPSDYKDLITLMDYNGEY